MTEYTIDGQKLSLEGKVGKTKLRSWTSSEKVHAAAMYVVMGSYTKVSELTGVPLKTLENWRHEPWWYEVTSRVKKEKNDELDAKFTQVLDKSVDELEDRVKNGDWSLGKNGDVVRTPVRSRDLSTIVGVLFDRRQLVRGEATSVSAPVNTDQKLKELWNKFEQFSKAKEITVEPDAS
jgi:transposase-like protein